MSAEFDPYYKWLGIPPAEQPPNLYRLLAIPLFEPDADVIDAAADGRMTHLRTFSAGKNGPLAQRLLNEVAAARVTLLNPQTRAAYDNQLRIYFAHIAAQQQAALPPPPPTAQPDQPAAPAFEIDAGNYSAGRQRGTPILLIAFVLCLAIGGTVGGAWYVMRGMKSNDTVVENPTVPTNGDPANAIANPPAAGENPDTPPTTGVPPASSENGTEVPAPTSDPPPAGVDQGEPATPATPVAETPAATTPDATPPVPEGRTIVDWPGHTAAVRSVDLSADGRFAVSGGDDKSIRVWDVASGKTVKLFQDFPGAIRELRIGGDGQIVAAACDGEQLVRVWQIDRPAEAALISTEAPFDHFDLSSNGQFVVIGGESFTLVFEANGRQLQRIPRDGYDVAITADGSKVALGGFHKVVQVHDSQTGSEVARFAGHTDAIRALSFSDDGRLLASAGPDGTVRVWDLASTGLRGGVADSAKRPIGDVGMSRDGRRVVATAGTQITVTDVSDAKTVYSTTGNAAALSSDGNSLLVGREDGLLQLVSLPPLPADPNAVAATVPQAGGLDNPASMDDRPENDPPVVIERKPVPPSDEVAKATKDLQEIYPKSEAKTPDDQLQLVDRVVPLALNAADPVEQYALLQFALSMAQGGGDARKMLAVIDTSAARFEIDPLETQVRELIAFAKGAKSEAMVDSLVGAATAVVDRAVAEGRMQEAGDLLDALVSACQKPIGKRHAKAMVELRSELAKEKKAWQAVNQARTTLENAPDDAAANLAVGRYEALQLEHWDVGLPHLARGSDEKLKTLAEQDLAAAEAGPREKLAIGDAWFEAAGSASPDERPAMLRRAGYWYREILPMVKQELARLRLTNRLEEIDLAPRRGQAVGEDRALPFGKWVYLLGATNLTRDAMGGSDWVKRREAVATSSNSPDGRFMLPVYLDGSYEFEFDFTAPQGHITAWLPVGERGCQLWFAQATGDLSGLSWIDGNGADRNQTKTGVPKVDWTKPHRLSVQVQQEAEQATIVVHFDDRPYLRWKGPHASLRGDRMNGIRDYRRIGLGSWNSPITFHSARVKLLSGKGRLTESPVPNLSKPPASSTFGDFD